MNAKNAVKVGDDGTYIAIAKVVALFKNPQYDFEAQVVFEDGLTARYLLLTSWGTGRFGQTLHPGDHVVVRFAKEDQFARLVSMDELASRLAVTVVG